MGKNLIPLIIILFSMSWLSYEYFINNKNDILIASINELNSSWKSQNKEHGKYIKYLYHKSLIRAKLLDIKNYKETIEVVYFEYRKIMSVLEDEEQEFLKSMKNKSFQESQITTDTLEHQIKMTKHDMLASIDEIYWRDSLSKVLMPFSFNKLSESKFILEINRAKHIVSFWAINIFHSIIDRTNINGRVIKGKTIKPLIISKNDAVQLGNNYEAEFQFIDVAKVYKTDTVLVNGERINYNELNIFESTLDSKKLGKTTNTIRISQYNPLSGHWQRHEEKVSYTVYSCD